MTADYRLWQQVEPFVGTKSTDIESARPRHLNGLTYVLNSKADFLLTKEQIKLGQYHDPVQWAADYYQVIKQSYAGKGSTFGGNGRSMWAAFPLIDAICARLQYVVIENADFGKIVPANDSPNTVFYLDPPYYFTEDYYPGQIFTESDHYRLFETIMQAKGLWLLSYNYRTWLSWTASSLRCPRPGSSCFWCAFPRMRSLSWCSTTST